MSHDYCFLNFGLRSHVAAAVLGVIAGAASVLPAEQMLEASTLWTWILVLVIVGGWGLIVGAISGGWAWILVGGKDRLHRIWISISCALTLGAVHQFSRHMLESCTGC